MSGVRGLTGLGVRPGQLTGPGAPAGPRHARSPGACPGPARTCRATLDQNSGVRPRRSVSVSCCAHCGSPRTRSTSCVLTRTRADCSRCSASMKISAPPGPSRAARPPGRSGRWRSSTAPLPAALLGSRGAGQGRSGGRRLCGIKHCQVPQVSGSHLRARPRRSRRRRRLCATYQRGGGNMGPGLPHFMCGVRLRRRLEPFVCDSLGPGQRLFLRTRLAIADTTALTDSFGVR